MPLTRPLTSLLAAPASDRRIAWSFAGSDHPSHAQLIVDVRGLQQRVGQARGERWLIETEDAYRVAVAFLAAAQAGARIVLPPNLQPRVLDALRQECDRTMVDEPCADGTTDHGDTRRIDPLAPGTAADATNAKLSTTIDRHAPLVDLYTSGSSGAGKLVTKALAHLEDEVVELENTLGGSLPEDAVVLSTVPLHHLYGLLFRLLWPLASRRPLARHSVLLPEDLLARVAETASAVLISSPAHLRHLGASPRLREQASRICAVFSSGGPLEPDTARSIEAQLGFAPVEIFGSTETGGVAWRRSSVQSPSPRWKVLGPVRVRLDEQTGCLLVTSPFVTPPSDVGSSARDSWTMGDRARLDGDGFHLLGRGDRVAKVGEKSIALPEMEQHLAEHRYVEIAAVGAYARPGGTRIGALVVLTAAARRTLAETGRRSVQAELAEHLAERWDRIALPRRWRFLGALPQDERGKLTQAAFETEVAIPAEEPRGPFFLARGRDGEEEVLEFVVPQDLAYFAGHYEGFPLVPGAVQIVWVMSQLSVLLDRPVSAERMEAIKFRNVLRPGQAFSMRLRVEGPRATFSLADGSRVFSSGRVVLAT